MGSIYDHPTYKNRVKKLQELMDRGGWIQPNNGFLYDTKDIHVTNVSQTFINRLQVSYCPIYCVYLTLNKPEEIIAARKLTSMLKGDTNYDLFKTKTGTKIRREQVLTTQYKRNSAPRHSW